MCNWTLISRILRKLFQISILPLLYNLAIFGLWFCSFWLCAIPYKFFLNKICSIWYLKVCANTLSLPEHFLTPWVFIWNHSNPCTPLLKRSWKIKTVGIFYTINRYFYGIPFQMKFCWKYLVILQQIGFE